MTLGENSPPLWIGQLMTNCHRQHATNSKSACWTPEAAPSGRWKDFRLENGQVLTREQHD
jgi:hypothetical protein